MTSEHIGDSAELYALGALSDTERRSVEKHAAACEFCTHALAEASDAVAAVAAAQPQHRPPPLLHRRIETVARKSPQPWRGAVAIAAAVAIALLPAAYLLRQNTQMHADMAMQTAAMDRLATQAHRVASFTPMGGGSVARVAYGMDGSWYVVFVRGAQRELAVAWMHDGQQTMLGTASRHGDVALLYLPNSHRMDKLALVDGNRVVAEAQLAY